MKSFVGRKNLDLASRQCSCPHNPQHETVLGLKRNHHLHHPPYSPDLAPCNFFLFRKLRGILKGTRFQRVEDIKTSVTRHLKTITKEKFLECGRKKWKSASKPLGIISKGTSRDDLRLVCVRQCGHCMICI